MGPSGRRLQRATRHFLHRAVRLEETEFVHCPHNITRNIQIRRVLQGMQRRIFGHESVHVGRVFLFCVSVGESKPYFFFFSLSLSLSRNSACADLAFHLFPLVQKEHRKGKLF
jgi:hypothetical protein